MSTLQKAKWNYHFDIGLHEDGVFNQDPDVDAVWEVLKQVSCNDIISPDIVLTYNFIDCPEGASSRSNYGGNQEQVETILVFVPRR